MWIVHLNSDNILVCNLDQFVLYPIANLIPGINPRSSDFFWTFLGLTEQGWGGFKSRTFTVPF